MAQKAIKLVSWNVNGLRAVWKKGFMDSFRSLDADIVALQETKIQDPQITDEMRAVPGYEAHWSCAAEKKGYSGVGVYTRIPPKAVNAGIGVPEFDNEGRILELDFGDFLFYNVYFPNGQMSDERLRYKLDFYEAFFDHVDARKDAGRRVIVTGDYNTAHNEIDLKNPKANENYSGFLRIERDRLDRITANGWVDAFRHFQPDTVKYSWWTYRFGARKRNAGWRIDYFFVSRNMIDNGEIADAFIDNDIYGSDHCPVGLDIRL